MPSLKRKMEYRGMDIAIFVKLSSFGLLYSADIEYGDFGNPTDWYCGEAEAIKEAVSFVDCLWEEHLKDVGQDQLESMEG